jgi:ribosomal protein S18 acetylase RimI-like enzyme
MSEESVPCRLLTWDSEFFRKRVARFEGERLDGVQWTATRAWCRREAIDCLYVLAPLDHAITRKIAGEPGVVLADVRLALGWQQGNGGLGGAAEAEPVRVRLGRPDDLPALRSIASLAHTQSRFYQDPGFAERAPALFERWIERSFEGFSDVVWVADEDDVPIGYVTCSRSARADEGTIGLLGVAETARGRGVARRLIDSAMRWFSQQGIADVTVVTQASNLVAQRVYLRAGFLPRAVGCWFHCWRVP